MLPELKPLRPGLRLIAAMAIMCAVISGESYAQSLQPCSNQSDDVDGDGYGWDHRSCLVTVESRPPPSIIDPVTGSPATLRRIYWSVEDLHNKSILCQLFDQRESGEYVAYSWKYFYNHFLYDNPTTIWLGPILEVLEEPGFDPQIDTDTQWYLQNGYYRGSASALSASHYVQPAGDSFRLWRDQSEYWSCKYASEDHSSTPTTYPPTINITDLYYVRCEDTPPIGDGWGWDGYGSCVYTENGSNQRYVTPDYVGAAPLHSTNNNTDTECDFSDASQYNGWGWNPVTRESCPPSASTTPVTTASSPGNALTDCVDTDGDGWGWTGTGSCVVAPNDQCDYTVADSNDGWGWNPVTEQSCPPRG